MPNTPNTPDTPRMIFVNLPVADLEKSKAFYSALGFTNEPRFTDDTAAAMVWSDTIFVMILTHDKWKSFTDRSIPPATSSEVSLARALGSCEAVAAMIAAAAAKRGTAAVTPVQDHGVMSGPGLRDPDAL